MADPLRVVVAGAAGRMGREVVRAVSGAPDMRVVAGIDRTELRSDAGVLAGVGPLGIAITDDLAGALASADVLVDFTVPDSVVANVQAALGSRVSPVVGTTGLAADDLERIRRWAETADVGALVAPNFAIGAVLMMQFARQAARHLPDAEIIELHHDRKLDSPSGTALLTAQLIAGARAAEPAEAPPGATEKVPGARGAVSDQVHVHSVRLQGFVAHQEVIFGGPGQVLTIRHDSTDRRSFMPGVLLAIRRVRSLPGLVVGLEHLL